MGYHLCRFPLVESNAKEPIMSIGREISHTLAMFKFNFGINSVCFGANWSRPSAKKDFERRREFLPYGLSRRRNEVQGSL